MQPWLRSLRRLILPINHPSRVRQPFPAIKRLPTSQQLPAATNAKFTLKDLKSNTCNETYIFYQLGEKLHWYSENNTDTQDKHFQGTITGNKISGSWSVLLNGSTQSGNRVLEIVTPNHLKAIAKTGAFGDIE